MGHAATAILQDLKLAVRQLRTRPGFVLLTTVILALGVGANTAVFSLAHGVLLRPLPYEEPERLVRLWPETWINKRAFLEVRDHAESYAGVTAFTTTSLPLSGDGEPEVVVTARVTPGHFSTLGVAPAEGRGFSVEESLPGADRVVILGHGLWQRRWGGRPDILGRSVRIHGELHEIVGVLGPGYRSLDPSWQLYIPLALDAADADDLDSSFYLQMVARLDGTVTLEQADDELARLAEGLLAKNPQRFTRDRVAAAAAVSLHEHLVGDARSTLVLLLAAVGTILLVACANLANLLLVRSEGRRREMAVRLAVGAGRGRIFGQMMVESLLLALLGSAAGLLSAVWAVDFLRGRLPADLPRVQEISIDGPVLAYACGLAVLAAVLFGLAPALRSARRDLAAEMSIGGRTARRSGFAPALVVVQVAASLALLVVALLLVRSLLELRSVDPGFQVEQMVALRPLPPQDRYPDHASVLRFYEQLGERLEALPSVRRAGAIQLLPLSADNWSFPYSYEGLELPTDAQSGTPLPVANFRIVTPGYFRAAGIPLRSGRAFTAHDGRAAAADTPGPARDGGPASPAGPPGESSAPPRVGLINQALADLLWPGEDPSGRRIQLFGSLPFEVVGVVGNIHQHGLGDGTRPEIYWPLAQSDTFGVVRSMVVMARAEGSPHALGHTLRQAVWSVDSEVPVAEIHVLGDLVHSNVAGPRLRALLLSAFALLALVLGMVGVYGLVAYGVSERLREIGIRMALGARRRTVLRQVLASGLALTVLGLALGLGLAAAVGTWVEEHLFGVSVSDPWIYGGASLALLVSAMLACWWPARRASRVDPAITLRHE